MGEDNGKSPVLITEGLTKRYDDGQTALDQVSFSVKPGEVYVMLGGNGAGKTTTINLLLNLIEPTAGKASIMGYVTHEEPLEAKKYVSFVSENVMLYGNFTAIENLRFFAKLGTNNGHSEDDLREALLRVGLEEADHHKKLREFSKGMRQKCGIAIAILKNAPVVLLDEPTSGLDPKAGFEFVCLLKSLREEGKAILMSTHDIFRAKEVADKIAILDQGKLVFEQAARDIRENDLQELYLKHMAGRDTTEVKG